MDKTDTFLLVFVCTGNICRSPMAEGIMKDILLDQARETGVSPRLRVISAGTHAIAGSPASEHAVEVAAEEGIHIEKHRSTPLTGEIVIASDLILTMEHAHSMIIENVWPETSMVKELKRFGQNDTGFSGNTDVMDPIGMGGQIYRTVFKEIRKEVTRVAPLIFSMAEKKAENLS